MTINYRGESGQDNFAHQQCGFKTNGTFIDIGCNEPRRWNNSFALEEIGWRGIGLDINPEYGPSWVVERKSPFIAADATTVDWPALLAAHGLPQWHGTGLAFDYLSLDIDENESRNLATTILQNLIAAGVSWRCATVEHDAYRYGDSPRAEIRKVLHAAGYRVAYANVEIRKGNGKPFEDWWVKA